MWQHVFKWLVPALALLAVASASETDNSKQDAVRPHAIRVCVINDEEASNCQTLITAFSNHPRLHVACVNKSSLDHCLTAFQSDEVDIMSLNPRSNTNSMVKLLEMANKEVIDMDKKYIPIAIVKKSSPIQRFDDPRVATAKLCISNADTFPNFWATAIRVNAISECYYTCKIGLKYEDVVFSGGVQMSDKPLKCLTSGSAEVVMIDNETAKKQLVEEGLNPGEYVRMCKEGRQPISNEDPSCNLYSMNLANNLQNQKERLFNTLAGELPRLLLKPYNELACNYQGDFKVFSSNATSAEQFLEREFGHDGISRKQLQEYRDSLPDPPRERT